MKKTLFLLGAALCCLASLSACGDKDEPLPNATATYQITLSPDAFAAANYIVRYKGNNNENKFEHLDKNTWNKTVTSNARTAEFGFKIEVSTKDVEELTKESYDLAITTSIHIARGASSTNRTPLDAAKVETKDKVPNWINNNIKNRVVGYTIDKNGEVETAPNMNFN